MKKHSAIKSISSTDHRTSEIKSTVPRLLKPEQWDYVVGALRVAQRSADPNDAGDKAIWEHIRQTLLAQEP